MLDDIISESLKSDGRSLKTKQNMKRQYYKVLKLSNQISLMESLILAQDERWRRA
jgi:hypothetical protein